MGWLWTPSICSVFPKQNQIPVQHTRKQTSFPFTNSTINSAMVYQNTHGARRAERNLPNMRWDWNLSERRTSPNRSRIRGWGFLRINCVTSETSLHLSKSLVFASSSSPKNTDPPIKSRRSSLALLPNDASQLQTKIRGRPVSWKRCSTASANSSGKPMPTKPPGHVGLGRGGFPYIGRIQIACMGQYLPF